MNRSAHARALHAIRLGRIIVNMRATMARTGRGYRAFSTKTPPFESTRKPDPIPPSLRRFRSVRYVR